MKLVVPRQLRKAKKGESKAGHKYASRERGADGRWRYTYDEPTTAARGTPTLGADRLHGTEGNTTMYETYHAITDTKKLAALAAAMRQSGWRGAPLVADGMSLITGAHRYVAAQEAGIAAPVVDIRELVPTWDAIIESYDFPTIDERDYVAALEEIDAAIRAEYGIDAH